MSNINYSSITIGYTNILNFSNYLNMWVNNNSSVGFSIVDSILLDFVQILNTNVYLYNSIKEIYMCSINQYLLSSILYSVYSIQLSVSNNINLNMNNNFFINLFLVKWFYLIVIISLLYWLLNITNYRNQYFYTMSMTIPKKIADLGEQEYGSFDDFQFLLIFMIYVFSWFCWVLFTWYFLNLNSSSWIILLVIIMTVAILTIPYQLLINFGSTFIMYVRGAASSSNLVVESLFDLIGIVIVFSRFIIQNGRLVLVFGAYFELFEWVLMSPEFNSIISSISYKVFLDTTFLQSNCTSMITFSILLFKLILIYLYNLLHLIVISFMQIGIYLMISFWLFFFLYTSFSKLNTEVYFKNIR